MSLKQIKGRVTSWRSQGQKVVLATGVFDLLHIEHIRFLKKAKGAGNRLIVGIEADARVKSLKGYARPVNSQKVRLEQLNALSAVDLAFTLPRKFSGQSDWEVFMASLRPDVYAVSSHDTYLKNKRAICQRRGIDFRVVHKHNPRYSTSLLITRLLGPQGR
jgi:cytidyltransferase-like protein